MLSFTGGLKIFVALEPCDMRRGFGSLSGAVYDQLKEDVRNGALYVFANKRRTRLKILYCDGTGMWLLTKRLDAGTFFWPRSSQAGQTKMALTPEVFALLTDGIDLHPATMRPWYERPGAGPV
jgi:transposase